MLCLQGRKTYPGLYQPPIEGSRDAGHRVAHEVKQLFSIVLHSIFG